MSRNRRFVMGQPRSRDRSSNTLRNCHCAFKRGVRQEDCKLFAPDASGQIFRSRQFLLNRERHPFQTFFSGLMAIAVVVLLEKININYD